MADFLSTKYESLNVTNEYFITYYKEAEKRYNNLEYMYLEKTLEDIQLNIEKKIIQEVPSFISVIGINWKFKVVRFFYIFNK